MAGRIKLNGTEITGRVDGLRGENANFVVTFQRAGGDSTPKKSYSGELTFYDDGYELLKAELINDPAGFNKEVAVELYDDCCKGEPVFVGVIRGDSIDWCEPKCFVKAQVFEQIPELNCFQSTIISDNFNGFQDKAHPKIRYCTELRPQFLHLVIIYFAFILAQAIAVVLLPIIIAIVAIIAVINVICNTLETICAIEIGGVALCTAPDCSTEFSNPISTVNFLIDLINDIINLVLGCGRFHPSGLLREYIENACLKCGLTFQSSILNDSGSIYYDTVLFSAPVEKGRGQNDTNGSLIKGNEPLLTLEQLFNEYLNPTFNAKYEIINGALVFERKDFFNVGATWLNTGELLTTGRILENQICFNWIDNPRPSFGRFEYSLDAQDYIGNEAKTRFNEIVEFNPSGSPLFAGELTRSLPFAPARFRGDGVNQTVMDYFLTFAGGIFNSVFGGQFSDNTNVLLMNQNTAFQLKLLIWDSATGYEFAKVKKDYSTTFTGGAVIVEGDLIPTNQLFNYPYWFKEVRTNNLYTEYHYIDNPQVNESRQFDFDFTVTDFDCNEFRNFDFDKIVKVVQSETLKNGEITQIEVNFTNRTIKIRGLV